MKKIGLNIILLFFYLINFGQPLPKQTIDIDLISVVKNTLAINPTIQRQLLAIERSKAELQNSQSMFDVQLTSELSYFRTGNHLLAIDPRNQFLNQIQNRNGQFSIGLAKTFRNSLTLQTSADWTRKSDNLPFNEFQQMEAPYLPRNTGNLALNFAQPLLRGRGKTIATANEKANEKLVEAQEKQLIQIAAREVFVAISTYWQYVGAQQIVKVNQQNEARVRQLLEMTETLVEADKKPKAELIQIQADLAQKQGQTILAKQNLLRLQQSLKSTIGFDENVLLNYTGSDAFPDPKKINYTQDLEETAFYDIALKHRTDLKALFLNQAALSNFLQLSENALKPQLDLSGGVGYGGFKVGEAYSHLLELFGIEEGRKWNAGVAISYTFPLQNNRSKAQFSLQKVALQDQKIILDNEVRNIKLNLNIAINNLKQSYAALQKSEETYNLFLIAFANEQEKFQNGLTTLINVILFQERLTLAEVQFIQFQQQFAIDLANLRLETGTLLQGEDLQQDNWNVSDFYTIPK